LVWLQKKQIEDLKKKEQVMIALAAKEALKQQKRSGGSVSSSSSSSSSTTAASAAPRTPARANRAIQEDDCASDLAPHPNPRPCALLTLPV
jgi:hypothetical protein